MVMGCSGSSNVGSPGTDSLYVQSLDELKQNLHALPAWEKVHAAEYLLWLGYGGNVCEEFLREEALHGGETPYRIGIWRVLAQCSATESGRSKYVDRICAAYRDPEGPDRLHAAETLAKLGVPLLDRERATTEQILQGQMNRIFVYTMWGASIGSASYNTSFRKQFLDLALSTEADDILRLQAAVALRNLRKLSSKEWFMLAKVALAEDTQSIAQVYLLSAAYFNIPPDSLHSGTSTAIREKLVLAAHSRQKGPRMEMAYALGECGGMQDIELLSGLLNNDDPLNHENSSDIKAVLSSNENADVRSSAAFGILRIAQRHDERRLAASTEM